MTMDIDTQQMLVDSARRWAAHASRYFAASRSASGAASARMPCSVTPPAWANCAMTSRTDAPDSCQAYTACSARRRARERATGSMPSLRECLFIRFLRREAA